MSAFPVEQSSLEQVARSMGISPRTLRPSRLDAIKRDRHFPSDEDCGTGALAEAMDDCRRPEEEVVDREVREQLDAALRRLNPFEAWVIRERFGLHESIADHKTRANPTPCAHHGATGDRVLDSQTDPSWSNRCRRGRTYRELKCDCGLSSHRIRQVERAALNKLRRLMAPGLNQSP